MSLTDGARTLGLLEATGDELVMVNPARRRAMVTLDDPLTWNPVA